MLEAVLIAQEGAASQSYCRAAPLLGQKALPRLRTWADCVILSLGNTSSGEQANRGKTWEQGKAGHTRDSVSHSDERGVGTILRTLSMKVHLILRGNSKVEMIIIPIYPMKSGHRICVAQCKMKM